MGHARGFILIIVIGLLGALALLAVNLASISKGSRELAGQTVHKAKARLLAKSGFEAGLSQSLAAFGPGLKGIRLTGNPTPGSSWCVSVDDTASRIDLNDGIAAGTLELNSAYDASAIDPWQKNPTSVEPETVVIASGTLGRERPPPGAAMCFLNDGAYASLINPGDVLVILSGPKTGNKYNILSANDMAGPRTRIVTDTPQFTISGYSFAWEVRQEIPGNVIVDFNESAWINLRLRRLLNAYGDACKFSNEIGLPPFLASDPNPNAGVPFTFTSTAAGKRNYPMPAVDASGVTLTNSLDIQSKSTGLGDRILAARPTEGFKSVEDIKNIINKWGDDHLTSTTYPKGFFDVARWDLTVRGSQDNSSLRVMRELGPYANTVDEDYPSDYYFDPTKPTFTPVTTDKTPPNLSGLFRPHQVSVINLNAASPMVRAAFFYSICNVSFACHSAETLKLPGWGSDEIKNARPTMGISGAIFSENRMKENGYPADPTINPVPANVQRNRFISLRDSLSLAQAWNHYSTTIASAPSNFEEFEQFLQWYELNGYEFERPLAKGIPYDPLPGSGYFTQDCVRRTLPHLLSGIHRFPSWMGSPAAMVSKLYEMKPPPYTQGRGMLYPNRYVEDFLYRNHLPKLEFLPGGLINLESYGRIGTESNQVISTINTIVEISHKIIFRSQQDFSSITESQDSSILIGPEISSQPTNPFVGFVGLKDLEDLKIGSPNIAMNFSDGILKPGFGTDAPGTPYHSPTDPVLDPSLQTTHVGNDDTLPVLSNSEIEDADRPALNFGGALPGITPFGGLRLISFGHGQGVAADPTYGIESDVFTDSMYWSLFDKTAAVPLAVQTSFDGTQPMVSHLGRGVVNLWFQIPTAQWTAEGWDFFQKRRFFRTLWQLRVVDEIERSSGYHQIASFITIGLTKNPDTGQFEIKGYWDEDQDAWAGHNFGAYFDYDGYLGPLFRVPNSSPGSDARKKYFSIFEKWWWKTWGRHLLTRTVTLKNIPENGPGTWHRLTVGWFRDPVRIAVGNGASDSIFWLRMRDSTRVDSMSGSYKEFASKYMFNSYQPHMWLTLGEALGTPGGKDSPILPITRFDGSVDNVVAWINDIPSTPVNYDPVYAGALYSEPANTQDPTRRYGIGMGTEPRWIVKPNVPAGSQLVHVGSRIYNPPTSDGNHPALVLGVAKGASLDPINATSWSPNEQNALFNTVLDDDLKLSLTWSNKAPSFDGDPSTSSFLIYDNTKIWTEIPWLKELRITYRPPGGPKIIRWSQE